MRIINTTKSHDIAFLTYVNDSLKSNNIAYFCRFNKRGMGLLNRRAVDKYLDIYRTYHTEHEMVDSAAHFHLYFYITFNGLQQLYLAFNNEMEKEKRSRVRRIMKTKYFGQEFSRFIDMMELTDVPMPFKAIDNHRIVPITQES